MMPTADSRPSPRVSGLSSVALALLASLAASTLLPDIASAQAPGVPAEVLVVLAKEDAGEIAPELRDMAALQRPPFNAYRSMRVLSRATPRLVVGEPVDVELPNGRTLRIVLQRVMPDGRFRVRASINRPGREDYLPVLTVLASPGDPFFVAGQGHEGGTLIIGVRLGTSPG